jgi:hypothetical protein
MQLSLRALNPLLIPALLAVAVCGYLVGSHRVSAPAEPVQFASKARLVSNSGLLLEYPIGWEQAKVSASIPGLPVSHAVTLHPRGSAQAGLLSGLLPAGEASPLPAAFLDRLKATPRTEVVGLVTTQAYRYSRLELPGYPGTFDLYVIPNAGAAPRVIACYAPRELTPTGQECEQVVEGVTLIGPAAPSLTPEPAYAASLASAIAALDRARVSTRAQMSRSALPSRLGSLAAPLGSRFAAAASSLAALEPPPGAVSAQGALVEVLQRAGRAYSALAEAARAESLAGYDAARTEVASAETGVDRALRSYSLLGYGAR